MEHVPQISAISSTKTLRTPNSSALPPRPTPTCHTDQQTPPYQLGDKSACQHRISVSQLICPDFLTSQFSCTDARLGKEEQLVCTDSLNSQLVCTDSSDNQLVCIDSMANQLICTDSLASQHINIKSLA